MYKNNQIKKPIRKLYFLVPATLILVLTLLVVLERIGTTDFIKGSKNSSTTTPPQVNEIPGTKPTNTVDYSPASPSDNIAISDKDPKAVTEPINNDLTATITSTRKSIDGASYLVKVAVAGTEAGTCDLSMSKGSKIHTFSSQIVLSANQYSCNNLQLPMSSLDEAGEWNIEVKVTDQNGATSSTSTKAIL